MTTTSSFLKFSARLREAFHWGARNGRGSMQLDRPHGEFDATVFERLALDLFVLQFHHNEPYRQLCQSRDMTPASITCWSQIPAVPTAAFKELELSCLPVGERTELFYSSGTTAQLRSRHFHSAESLTVYDSSMLAWFDECVLRVTALDKIPAHAFATAKRLRLICLTPGPAEAPHSSLAHMFETLRREVGTEDSTFLGQTNNDGEWTLNVVATIEQLEKASLSGERILLMGTAFSFVHLLDHLAERKKRFTLPSGSMLLETGGYKGRSRSLPKTELHSLMTRHLGIPAGAIICEYGMSELSSQAYDTCTAHERPRVFHFPPWAAVQIISPETGAEVGEGETGLLRIFDLANVYSVMAIQTEDLGIKRGDGFELLGRTTFAESRGCSLMVV